jgi:hypothetical protein
MVEGELRDVVGKSVFAFEEFTVVVVQVRGAEPGPEPTESEQVRPHVLAVRRVIEVEHAEVESGVGGRSTNAGALAASMISISCVSPSASVRATVSSGRDRRLVERGRSPARRILKLTFQPRFYSMNGFGKLFTSSPW